MASWVIRLVCVTAENREEKRTYRRSEAVPDIHLLEKVRGTEPEKFGLDVVDSFLEPQAGDHGRLVWRIT